MLWPSLQPHPASWRKLVFVAGTPGLGSAIWYRLIFSYIVERSMSSIAAAAFAARVLQGRRDEQSLKLLECRADRDVPDRTRLRRRGIDAIRKGARITPRGGDFDIGRFWPRVTT
jgi:hypothetical protein